MRFSLPSGALVDFRDDAPAFPRLPGIFGSELCSVRGTLVRDGTQITLGDLPLSDFHTLRTIARRLELVPYRHGELDDPELDAPFDFGKDHPIESNDPRFTSARLAPITTALAEALHVALSNRLRLTSRVILAMGLVELGGESAVPRIA